MKDAPISPSALQTPAQLSGPRDSITQFVEEVCYDLEASRARLAEVESIDALVAATTDTHKTLDEHEQTMSQFVKIVNNWRQESL